MTVYGAVVAAVSRKIGAFLAEVRKLVAEATVVEKQLIRTTKSGIAAAIARAKEEVNSHKNFEKAEKTKLKSDLVDKIAKL